MWAKVELSDEIISFINNARNHIESFEEVKELVFSEDMLKKQLSIVDVLNYTLLFQEIKTSAFNKVLKGEKLNYPEGIVFERLLAKAQTKELISFDKNIEDIRSNCHEVKSNKKRITNRLFKLMKGEN